MRRVTPAAIPRGKPVARTAATLKRTATPPATTATTIVTATATSRAASKGRRRTPLDPGLRGDGPGRERRGIAEKYLVPRECPVRSSTYRVCDKNALPC